MPNAAESQCTQTVRTGDLYGKQLPMNRPALMLPALRDNGVAEDRGHSSAAGLFAAVQKT